MGLGYLKLLIPRMGVLLVFLFAPVAYPNDYRIKAGEIATVVGTLLIAQDYDAHEKLVPFEAIKLEKPLLVITEDGEREVKLMKLWGDQEQKEKFKKLLGSKVRAKGTVLYYWHGPSTFPVPAKFEVISLEAASK